MIITLLNKIIKKFAMLNFPILNIYALVKQIIEESELRNLHHGNFKAFLTHLLNVTLSLATISVSGYIQCGFACLENVACISFNFAIVPDIYSKQHACHLLPTDKYKNPDYFVTSQQFHHYAIPVGSNLDCLNLADC